jgi:transcriptional regulator with GAF, ATPase, and Fis domain
MTDAQAIADAVEDLDPYAWNALENLGRTFHVKGADLSATLVAVLTEAVSLTDGTKHAGVNLYIKGRFEPQAVFGDAPLALDSLQQRTGDGPCIAASRDQQLVQIKDMTAEGEWPQFRALAVEQGVRAMLCLPLWVDDTRLGSLSLYSEEVRDFDERAGRVASLLATHAALVLSDALRTENLRRAIEGRDVIGQAKGILMERHRITADDAFEQLTKASQRANRKLSEVARSLVETGELSG